MKQLDDLMADHRRHFGNRWSLPEYRQVELYAKHKKLPFAEAPAASASPDTLPDILGIHVAFMLLDSAFASRDPELWEGKTTWERYLALPKATTLDKLAAEVYRLLRILRIAALHGQGRLELREGLVRASATFGRCALSLNITPAGLRLLEAFVHVHLAAAGLPYSPAYTERLLLQYFTDIVTEIHKFADEDRALYQFRSPGWFNRHFRLDCDNPKFEALDGRYRFEIGTTRADPARSPIDFFLVVNDELHIVPVEALKDSAIGETELPRWRARTPFQHRLPAEFRQRFGREDMVVGLPMT